MSNPIFDLVRVQNTGTEELVLRGNTRYTIPAGGERILPFNEAASWFGDPRLQNVGRDRIRDMCWRQTQNLWGYTEGMTYLKDRWDPTQGFKVWEDFMPSVRCFDMDGGEVFFLIHDPEGTKPFNGPALIDPATQDNTVLTSQVATMTRQIAELQQIILERQAAEARLSQPTADAAVAQLNEAFDAVNLPQAPADDTVGDDAPKTVSAKASK